jgi:hypothetical protein
MKTEPATAPANAGDPLGYYSPAGHTSEANVDTPKRTLPPFNWIYVVAIVLALATLGCGIYQVVTDQEGWAMVGAGCLGLVAVLASWPITLCLHDARCSRAGEREATMQPLIERIDQMSILINTISEQQLLSDRAKSIAYRVKDREAVRRAISEEMAKQDWEAALVLADEIERGFGYRGEAARVRAEIDQRRQENVRRQINDVMGTIDRHTRAEQWSAALREAERLMQMFPDNEQVRSLPVEIENRRQAHKRQLLSSWTDAVARHDVDGSIEILKQLDTYLTPSEAESMQETARSVFKEKLNNLGKQFGAAVQDRRWVEAIRIGETVIREFPNSRIAQEVRENMDSLRQRAAEPGNGAAAAVPAGANA